MFARLLSRRGYWRRPGLGLLAGGRPGLRLVFPLHADWATRLLEETSIDYGYRRCGGFYLANTTSGVDELEQQAAAWRRDGIAVESLSPAAVAEIEPALGEAAESGLLRAALLLPDEVQ